MHDGPGERAAGLRREALALLDSADVLGRIERAAGRVELVGSAALDLMVWRDVDLCTALAPDEGPRLLALGHELAAAWAGIGSPVIRASFHDEYRRPGSGYGEGLYPGLRVLHGPQRAPWKLDLWAWEPARLEAKLTEHRRLASALARVDRELVLALKEAVLRRPDYRDTLTALDVYRFVIAGEGRTVEELERFLAAERGEGGGS